MFSSEQWLANSGADFYNGQATQSVRFEGDNSAGFLSRTGMSASNRRTWTWSCWVKRINLDANTQGIFGMIDLSSVNRQCYIAFDSNHKIYIMNYSQYAGDAVYNYVTTQVFRDLSAWYHIVWVSDTTNGTAGDRIRLYVNGVRITSFTIATNPSQNYEGWINGDGGSGVQLGVGRVVPYAPSAEYLASYMSDANFVDGLALAPTNFGEFKFGAWIPIEPDVSDYGTNGFRLKFDQVGVGTASTSTIGADSSGKTNHYTSSGIVASDCAMPDSPENNFCTLNPNARGTTNVSTSEGNLKFVKSGANYGNIFSTFALFGGKWYFEGRCHSSALAQIGVQEITNNIYQSSGDYGASTDLGMWDSRGYYLDEGTAGGSPPTYTTGDIIGVAFDVDAGKIWFSKNGTYNHSGDPASGTNQTTGSTNDLSSIGVTPAGNGENGGGHVLNFGQNPSFGGGLDGSEGNEVGTETDGNGFGLFKFAPPSGFLSLSSKNLPEPTIGPNSDTQADDYFNTVLYTGDGATSHAITGVGFSPDWVWGKKRSASGDNWVFDTSRGATKQLETNSTNVESTQTTMLKTFDSDGFTMGNDSPGNADGTTLVAWNWLANGGTTSSNSDGSITSTVQANTTSGFSIVLYNGEGDGQATVGHGLGVKPQVIIPKNRSTTGSYHMYHEAIDASAPQNYGIILNSTNARTDDPGFHNDTAPTSSVFTIGTYNNFDNDYVAYCFAEVEGYSKFGSYTGNGNADGTFVYTGFRPAFIMFKTTTIISHWTIVDNARSTYNVVDDSLYADTSAAELTTITDVDFLSNGFKWRGVLANETNVNGQVYIYMAFAEAPFKYANAR